MLTYQLQKKKKSRNRPSTRVSSVAAGEPLISRGERSLGVGWVGWCGGGGGNQWGNQIRLYKGVSHSCLVETLHLAAPLQVNNHGPGVPPLHPAAHPHASAATSVDISEARAPHFTVEHLNTHSVGVGAVTRPPTARDDTRPSCPLAAGTPELLPACDCGSSDIPVIRRDK